MGAAPTLGRSGPATCPLSPCAPVQRGRAGAARPSGKPWALEPQIMRSDAKSQKIASSFRGITWFLSPTTPARGNASSCKIMPHMEMTHMGREHASREKKLPMVNFLIFGQKNVSTIRFQEIKIRPFQDFEKMRFLCFYIIQV